MSLPSSCCHVAQGKVLYRILIIAFLFMAIEIGGGYIANSLALFGDALHLFMDVGAIVLSLVVLKIAHLPRTPTMSYGYHRAEILGALANALSLWILCAILIYQAFVRLMKPQEVQGAIVFIVAAIGLIANIMMILKLHPIQKNSLNMRAVYLHILGDLLGSIGVLLSGALIWLTQLNYIDSIITILLALGILYGSGKVIAQSIKILMQSTPEGVDPLAIERDLKSIKSVIEVHDLHVWTISSHTIALSVHLVTSTPQLTLNEAHDILQKNHGIHHMTIQAEDPSSFEPRFCYDCETSKKASLN